MLVIGRIFRKLFSYIRIGCIKLFRKNITLGKKLSFRKRFTINCSREGKLAIGDNVFFNNDCSLNVRQSVTIGNDSIFGEAVKIYDHNHVFKTKGQKVADQGFSCKPVVIGNNCWIGSNAVILAGTEIGDNTVIGAGCVVHGVIPPDSVLKNSSNYTLEKIKYTTGEMI